MRKNQISIAGSFRDISEMKWKNTTSCFTIPNFSGKTPRTWACVGNRSYCITLEKHCQEKLGRALQYSGRRSCLTLAKQSKTKC